jgi:NADH-quinone oxidoreductase subunit J
MELFLFIVVAGITLISGFLVVFQRNSFYSALFLILAFISMAGLYLMLGAEFIALIQILVYAGAIMVLFLFVIMFLNLDKEKREWITTQKKQKYFCVIVVAILVAVMITGISASLFYSNSQSGAPGGFGPKTAAQTNNTTAISSLLFTDYILPFEMTSILLLVAMAGVVYLSKRSKKKEPDPSGQSR